MKFADVRKYVKGLLSSSFVNKSVLDKLGEDDNNNLTYNGAAIEGGGDSGLAIAAQIYSEEERIVGCWTNGKPLYQKTIMGKITDSNVNCTIPLNIGANSFTVIEANGYMVRADGNQVDSILYGDYYAFQQIIVNNTTDEILIMKQASGNYGYNNTYIITIKYTKNADEENSFTEDMITGGVITLPDNIVLHAEDGEVVELPTAAPINLIEVDAELSETSENPVQNKVITTKLNEIAQSTGGGNAFEIYSTTEQKIGTWIDGRTLYSCTYHIESLPGANESITFGSRKYHKIISFEGFASHKEVDWFFPLPYINASNEKIIIDSVADGDENKCIRITATTDRSDVEAWVTVKYTAVERDTDGKPELEFSTAGELIISINGRSYYKTNNDLAIGGWGCYHGWYAPYLVSRTMEGSMYYSNAGGGNSSNTGSLEYEGETWYYSNAYYAWSYCDSFGNGRALYLNDIEGIEDMDANIVKAILDYYFYHS